MALSGSDMDFGTPELHEKLCYGQVILLLADIGSKAERRGFVCGTPHLDPQVWVDALSGGSGAPPSLHRSRFLVCPQSDYDARKQYAEQLQRIRVGKDELDARIQSLLLDNIRTSLREVLADTPLTLGLSARADSIAEELEVYREACVAELDRNQERLERCVGDPVRSASLIQLKEVSSGRFLSIQFDGTGFKHQNLKIVLLDGGDASSRFKVWSAVPGLYGALVTLGKRIRLESEVEAHMNLCVPEQAVQEESKDGSKPRPSKGSFKVGLSDNEVLTFTVIMDSFLPPSEEERARRGPLLHGFQDITIRRAETFLTVQDTPADTGELQGAEGWDAVEHERQWPCWIRRQPGSSELCSWRVVPVNRTENDLAQLGMPITYRTKFRLVHVVSDLYLCCSKDTHTGKVRVTKEYDDPGCLFSFSRADTDAAGNVYVAHGSCSYVQSMFGTWLSMGSSFRMEVEQIQRCRKINKLHLKLVSDDVIAALLAIEDCASAVRAFVRACRQAKAAAPIDHLRVSLMQPEQNPGADQLKDVVLDERSILMVALRRKAAPLIQSMACLIHLMSHGHRIPTSEKAGQARANMYRLAVGRAHLIDGICHALDAFPFAWFMLQGVGTSTDRGSALCLCAYMHEFLRTACAGFAPNWLQPSDKRVNLVRQHVGGTVRASETVAALTQSGYEPVRVRVEEAINNLMAEFKPEKLGRQTHLLRNLKKLCGIEKRPIMRNQVLIMRALREHSHNALVRVQTSGHDEEFDVHLTFWGTVESVDSISCHALRDGGGDDHQTHDAGSWHTRWSSSPAYARNNQLFEYFVKLLDLYRAVCSSRNDTARQLLFEANEDLHLGVEQQTLLVVMQARSLPYALRSAATRLLAVLYVDVNPYVDVSVSRRTLLVGSNAELRTRGDESMPQYVVQAITSILLEGRTASCSEELGLGHGQLLLESFDLLFLVLKLGVLPMDNSKIAEVLHTLEDMLTGPECSPKVPMYLKAQICRLFLLVLDVWEDHVIARAFARFERAAGNLERSDLPDEQHQAKQRTWQKATRVALVTGLKPSESRLPGGSKVADESYSVMSLSAQQIAVRGYSEGFQALADEKFPLFGQQYLQDHSQADSIVTALLQILVYGAQQNSGQATNALKLLLRLTRVKERLVGALVNTWIVDKGISRLLHARAKQLVSESAVHARYLDSPDAAEAAAALEAVTLRFNQMAGMLTSAQQVNTADNSDAKKVTVTVTRSMALDFQRIYVEIQAHELALSIIKLPVLPKLSKGAEKTAALVPKRKEMFQACWRFLAALCRVVTSKEAASEPGRVTNEHNQRMLFGHLDLLLSKMGTEGIDVASTVSAILYDNAALTKKAREPLIHNTVELLARSGALGHIRWLQLLIDVVWNDGNLIKRNAAMVLFLLDMHRSRALHLMDVVSPAAYQRRLELMRNATFEPPHEAGRSLTSEERESELNCHRCSLQLIADCCRSPDVAGVAQAPALLPFDSFLAALLHCYNEGVSLRLSRFAVSAYWSCLRHVYFAMSTEVASAAVQRADNGIFDTEDTHEQQPWTVQDDSDTEIDAEFQSDSEESVKDDKNAEDDDAEEHEDECIASADAMHAHASQQIFFAGMRSSKLGSAAEVARGRRGAVPVAEAGEEDDGTPDDLELLPAASKQAAVGKFDPELDAALRSNSQDRVPQAAPMNWADVQSTAAGASQLVTASPPPSAAPPEHLAQPAHESSEVADGSRLLSRANSSAVASTSSSPQQQSRVAFSSSIKRNESASGDRMRPSTGPQASTGGGQSFGTASSLLTLLVKELQAALKEPASAMEDPASALSILLKYALPCFTDYLEHHYKQHVFKLPFKHEVQIHRLASRVVRLRSKFREDHPRMDRPQQKANKVLEDLVQMLREQKPLAFPSFIKRAASARSTHVSGAGGMHSRAPSARQSTFKGGMQGLQSALQSKLAIESKSEGENESGSRDLNALWKKFVKKVAKKLGVSTTGGVLSPRQVIAVRKDIQDVNGNYIEDAAVFTVCQLLTPPWRTPVPLPDASSATQVLQDGEKDTGSEVADLSLVEYRERALKVYIEQFLPRSPAHRDEPLAEWPEELQQKVIYILRGCMHIDDGAASKEQWQTGWPRLLGNRPPSLDDSKRPVTRWMQNKYNRLRATELCVYMIARPAKGVRLEAIHALTTLLEGGNREVLSSLRDLLIPNKDLSKSFCMALRTTIFEARARWSDAADSAKGDDQHATDLTRTARYAVKKKERKRPDRPETVITHVFRCLQLFVEGHYLPFQELLVYQGDDSVNFLFLAVESLNAALTYHSDALKSDSKLSEEDVARFDLMEQLLAFITEMVQACSPNREAAVTQTQLLPILNRTLAKFRCIPETFVRSQVDDKASATRKAQLRKRLLCLLLDLQEGETASGPVCQCLLNELDYKLIKCQLADITSLLAEKQSWPQDSEQIEPDDKEKRDEGSAFMSEHGDIFSDVYLNVELKQALHKELGLILQLLRTLQHKATHCEHESVTHEGHLLAAIASASRPAPAKDVLAVTTEQSEWVASIREAMNHRIGSIEILWNGRLQRIFFVLPPICQDAMMSPFRVELKNMMKQAAPKTRLVPYVKAKDMLAAMEVAVKLLAHDDQLRGHRNPRYVWVIKRSMQLDGVAVGLALASVILLCFQYGRSFEDFRKERPFALVLVLTLNCLSCAAVAMRAFACFTKDWLLWHRATHGVQEEAMRQLIRRVHQTRTEKALLACGVPGPPDINQEFSVVALTAVVLSFLRYRNTYPLMMTLVCNVLSLIYSPIFVAANFLLVFTDSGTGRMLFEALAEGGWGIMRTCWLAAVTLILFAIGSFMWFQSGISDDQKNGALCQTLYQCVGMHFVAGIQGTIEFIFDSEMGVDLVPLEYTEARGKQMLAFWILMFYMIWNFVLSNIFVGQIVDAFSATREQKQTAKEDTARNCLVCSIVREAFQDSDSSFEEHVATEHNVLHYIFFLYHLRSLKPEEYTGLESWIATLLQKGGIERAAWLPVQNALSLQSAQRRRQAQSKDMRTKLDEIARAQEQLARETANARRKLLDLAESQAQLQKDQQVLYKAVQDDDQELLKKMNWLETMTENALSVKAGTR